MKFFQPGITTPKGRKRKIDNQPPPGRSLGIDSFVGRHGLDKDHVVFPDRVIIPLDKKPRFFIQKNKHFVKMVGMHVPLGVNGVIVKEIIQGGAGIVDGDVVSPFI
jgi:hypothetical protein